MFSFFKTFYYRTKLFHKTQYLILRYCKVFSGDTMRYEVMKFENIRNLRIDKGYTQKQIAEYLGISQNTYSQYEVGVLNYPVDAVVKLADFYGVSTDFLLGRTNVKEPYSSK